MESNSSNYTKDVVVFFDWLYKKGKTYTLVFNSCRNYFIYQFDYKPDGLWIKYSMGAITELKDEIKKLGQIFDVIAEDKTEYGWRFDRDKLQSVLHDMSLYKDANKYNL